MLVTSVGQPFCACLKAPDNVCLPPTVAGTADNIFADTTRSVACSEKYTHKSVWFSSDVAAADLSNIIFLKV